MKKLKGIIFDIDGTLQFKGQVYPGATDTVNILRKKGLKIRFQTNSTLKSRRSTSERLQQGGFHVREEEIITASYATAHYLEKIQPKSCWIMVDGAGAEEFRNINQDEEDPEYLVIGDYRSHFDFDTLNRALRLLMKGKKLIGMQAEQIDDSSGPTELNVGAWVNMLEQAAGVKAIYIGKPHPYSTLLTLESMGLDRDEVVMVGDRLSTDIMGARNLGIRSLLVKTGEFKPNDLDKAIQPDLICDSIREVPEALF